MTFFLYIKLVIVWLERKECKTQFHNKIIKHWSLLTYLWEKDSKYDLLYASMADIQPLIQLFWMHMNDSLWIHYHNKCFISHWELEIKLPWFYAFNMPLSVTLILVNMIMAAKMSLIKAKMIQLKWHF